MKKKLSFRLVVLVLLAVGVLHYWAAPTFDHAFQCNGIGPPAKPGGSFKVLREGTYPGLIDAPVTFDEGRTYRELLAALRGQRYLRLPALLGPPRRDRLLYRIRLYPRVHGLLGRHLSLAGLELLSLAPLSPPSPRRPGEKLELIFMDEPEENIYYPSS